MNNEREMIVMKHYSELINMGCFTREDVRALLCNEAATHSLLYDYAKKGLVERVRRNLYVAISLETNQPVRNRYAIASKISNGSYITHHSAFEYYGSANQVYYEVYVSGEQYFSEFEYDGITFKYMKPHINGGIIINKDGVCVTDVERTLLDSINDFEKISGLEELLKCIEQMPPIEEEKLLSYLSLYNSKYLYQKAGYILENFTDIVKLSNNFFQECLKNIPNSKRYLYKSEYKKDFILNKKWNLYVPNNLLSLINKGVDYDGYV